MSLTDAMARRYAVKKFEPGVRRDAALVEALEAARLAPSSYGLQPWRIVLVEDPALRRTLREYAWDAAKVEEAGHLLVFAHLDPITADDVEAHVALTATTRGLSSERAEGLRGSLTRNLLERRGPEERRAWARAQCYIGLGVFLAACADLGLDAGPMEGFQPDRVDEALGLGGRRLHAAAFVVAGSRAGDDAAASQAKVRMPLDDLVLRMPAAAQAER